MEKQETDKSELEQQLTEHETSLSQLGVPGANKPKFSKSQIEDAQRRILERLEGMDADLTATQKNGTSHSESCQATLTWQKNDQDQWRLHNVHIQQK